MAIADEMPHTLAKRVPDTGEWVNNSRDWMTKQFAEIDASELLESVENLYKASTAGEHGQVDWNAGRDKCPMPPPKSTRSRLILTRS